jgi:3-methyl-2-oxobutanoate hydroxymethyltransferase
MPFGSYQASADEAVKSAVRLVAEGGAEAVKLEGGAEFADVIRRITRAGVPVMGHIGLTPQSVHKMGGYVVQGKDSEKAQRLLRDARALEDAGCFALVLECIPAELARVITGALGIATIGIGAGPHCDGQVLVVNDLLGLDGAFQPKFVKRFAELSGAVQGAVGAYAAEVRAGTFPAEEHSFHSKSLRLLTPVEDDRPDADAQVVGAPV